MRDVVLLLDVYCCFESGIRCCAASKLQISTPEQLICFQVIYECLFVYSAVLSTVKYISTFVFHVRLHFLVFPYFESHNDCLNCSIPNPNAMVRRYPPNPRCYEECLFGYSSIVHKDICTFTLAFSHGNKSRAGQGARD